MHIQVIAVPYYMVESQLRYPAHMSKHPRLSVGLALHKWNVIRPKPTRTKISGLNGAASVDNTNQITLAVYETSTVVMYFRGKGGRGEAVGQVVSKSEVTPIS